MEAWAQGGRAGRNHRGWAGAFNETTAKRHPFATFGFPRTYADELLKLPRYTPDPRMPASAYSWGARAQLRRACSIELATPDLSKLCLILSEDGSVPQVMCSELQVMNVARQTAT
jgi:hypothetical protein